MVAAKESLRTSDILPYSALYGGVVWLVGGLSLVALLGVLSRPVRMPLDGIISLWWFLVTMEIGIRRPGRWADVFGGTAAVGFFMAWFPLMYPAAWTMPGWVAALRVLSLFALPAVALGGRRKHPRVVQEATGEPAAGGEQRGRADDGS